MRDFHCHASWPVCMYRLFTSMLILCKYIIIFSWHSRQCSSRYPTLAICNFPEGIGASTRHYLETKLLDRCPIDLSLDNRLDPVGTLIGTQFSGSFARWEKIQQTSRLHRYWGKNLNAKGSNRYSGWRLVKYYPGNCPISPTWRPVGWHLGSSSTKLTADLGPALDKKIGGGCKMM